MMSHYEQKKKGGMIVCFKAVLKEMLDVTVGIYVFLMLAVLPFYNQEGFRHIGTDKSVFFRSWGTRFVTVAGILMLAYAVIQSVETAKEKKLQAAFRKGFITDYFVLFYGIAVAVSFLLSEYRNTAVLGAVGWYMGTVAQLILVVSYFALSFFGRLGEKIFFVALPVSWIVFLLGILNRFEVYPIDMKVKNPNFISTIGNVNWYCGYMVVVLFFGIGYFIFEKNMSRWKSGIVSFYLITGFLSLETQGSDSGFFALALVMLVLFLLVAADTELLNRFSFILILISICGMILWMIRKTTLWNTPLNNADRATELMTNTFFAPVFFFLSVFFHIICWYEKRKGKTSKIMKNASLFFSVSAAFILVIYLAFTAVNTMQEGRLSEKLGFSEDSAFEFTPQWGSNRGATWMAGLRTFHEQNLLHKMIGVGPDCMSEYIYADGSEELLNGVKEVFGNTKLTNSHNEWLTILVDEGILGFVGFAGTICGAIVLLLGRGSKNPTASACGLAVLAYTLNNVFSFQQSVNTPTMFIFLGIGVSLLKNEKNRNEKKNLPAEDSFHRRDRI